MSGIRVASGHLFFFYAYDAGFEIALEKARAFCEASDSPGIAGPLSGDINGVDTIP